MCSTRSSTAGVKQESCTTLHYTTRHGIPTNALQSLREMAHPLPFILVALLLVFLPSNSAATLGAKPINNSEIDRQALLSFKAGISADPLRVLRSWRSHSLNFCGWRGISCGKALPPRVVSMELNSSQLVGQLSPSLANLTFLARLDLGINMFSGRIPDELGTLPKLRFLMLATNNLSGNIPRSLGSRNGSLAYVNLAENALRGGIPHLLATSSSLTVLNLARNNLSGLIPASLFNGTNLVIFNLGLNFFSGPIPDFHKLVSLEILALYENNISGSIPPSLGNASSLSKIYLHSNDLGGSIPETLSHIQNLSVLYLSNNNLSGNVPTSFYNISSLIALALSSNSLTGRIPSAIWPLPKLKGLFMSDNQLEGPLPAALANASQLEILDLGSNLLSGPIPFDIGNLAMLEVLDLGQNKITNTIPISIGYLSRLQMLVLNQNFLSGGIPPIIANLSGLVILNLSKNKLSGQIPAAIGELSMVNKLHLDNNNFSGNIPATLGKCTQLVMLNLSANILNGSIPSELLTITSLSLGLDLSNNYLTGPIPAQIGKLIHLVFLDISFNSLFGQLPSSLGQCVSLLSIDMSRNMLNGTLTQSLGNLKYVSWIDLSHNDFVGQIPEIFSSFAFLMHLDLSNNHLEGPIPTGGVFQNITARNLYGNLGLCANATTSFLFEEFPICPEILARGTKNNIAHLLVIVIPPITIALLSFLCFMVTLLKKGEQTTPCYKDTMKKVSYGDILKATNWFSPINKISSSQTSSVYLGRFEFDTDLVAIKLFHLNEHGSLNSFHMECEVLKNSRHRNLMKAATLCSTVDSENNEFKAIIFDFMANGSLDMWVHPKLYQTTPTRCLSLGQRIRIATDVASALDYMHNQLTPPLVHCDLKPANVLLDYDMTARIGDFGSAKFLTSGLDSPEGIVATGGTIGYIAPEYGMGYKISTGCDVYSFGVLLLEMFTGKRPTDTLFIDGMNLHKFVSLAFPDRLVKVLDPYMSQEGSHACADLSMQSLQMRMVEVGLLCSMESPKDRPVMQEVCTRIFAIKEAFLDSW